MKMQTATLNNEYGEEWFITLETPTGLNVADSIARLTDAYEGGKRDLGLGSETEIMVRVHLSDIANQLTPLLQSFSYRQRDFLLSVVGQPPARGGKFALQAYHIKAAKPVNKVLHEPGVLTVKHGNYTSLWMSTQPSSVESSYQQTHQIFGSLSQWLHSFGARLEDDVQRTWIFVRDVDNNYRGMVDARRELFRFVGLNESTHYIASTGIEGLGPRVNDLVTMDSLSVLGLSPLQIRYMAAEDHLCPTHEYAVTFERGTQLVYSDRSHYYISGTASIDSHGNVLHVGDVSRQCSRTLANIRALLTNYGGDLEDIKLLVVYLRDTSDTHVVEDFLKASLSSAIPTIFVKGAVCRPTWLVEMEAIAVKPWKDNRFSPFC